MSGAFNNPLYQPITSGGVNPLYQGPSHKYPSQVIVQFVTGGPGDATIETNAQALNTYGRSLGIDSRIVKVRASHSAFHTFSQAAKGELAAAFGRLNGSSRVYLQAHGDWETQKLADWGPHDIADLLASCGMPAVRVVSILGCELGRDRGTANNARVGNSMNSFASRFHRRLRVKHGISTVVYARIHCIGIGNPVEEAGDPSVHGHKGTFDDNDAWSGWTGGSAHRVHSKLKFWWEGGNQRRDWSY